MCNGLPRTTLSYSGDALRSFNVQPTSQLCRDVRKRLFSLRIRIWYKHVNKGNSNMKQSFDHIVTVRKSVPDVKLGVINCQSINGKLDFVFDHIKEHQLDIVALTETWLSNEDSNNKHVIDQCVTHGYTLHHSPRYLHTNGLWIFLKLLILYNILTSQHITVVIYLIIYSQGMAALVCQICMYLTLSVITELYMYH